MPRGNDPEAAAEFDARLYDQYGVHANAQSLIDAHQASVDPAVTRASLTNIDPEATEEAQADLEAAAGKLELDDDDKVLAVAVRGNALVAVVENKAGMTRKVVGPWTDDYEAPQLAPQEQQRRAEILRDQEVAQETARLRAEADAKIAEARAEEDARITEEIAKIKEDADKKLADAVEEMESGDEPVAAPARSTPKRATKSESTA